MAEYVMEEAIQGDFAIVKADIADDSWKFNI